MAAMTSSATSGSSGQSAAGSSGGHCPVAPCAGETNATQFPIPAPAIVAPSGQPGPERRDREGVVSAVEDPPAEVVPPPLVIEHEFADRPRELIAGLLDGLAGARIAFLREDHRLEPEPEGLRTSVIRQAADLDRDAEQHAGES